MYDQSWQTAERLLREAKNWIFIGYSLPAADYEFKLLLKRVQLSRKAKPNLGADYRGLQGCFLVDAA